MRYTEIFIDPDGLSRFREVEITHPHRIELGDYSDPFEASQVLFWSFPKGCETDWHTAPQEQFVVILAGKIAVETDAGERREFTSGDILLANNLTGRGHRSYTLSAGTGMLIPKEALGERLQRLVSGEFKH